MLAIWPLMEEEKQEVNNMKAMEHQDDNTNRLSTFANEETLETKDKSLKNRKNQSLTRRIKDKLMKG